MLEQVLGILFLEKYLLQLVGSFGQQEMRWPLIRARLTSTIRKESSNKNYT
jgi:hypothetical protein